MPLTIFSVSRKIANKSNFGFWIVFFILMIEKFSVWDGKLYRNYCDKVVNNINYSILKQYNFRLYVKLV